MTCRAIISGGDDTAEAKFAILECGVAISFLGASSELKV